MAKRKTQLVLNDSQFPEFLSNAALRAARKWDSAPKETVTPQGSPGFVPSRAQAVMVAQLTALGLEPKDISAVLRIDKKLLEFYYDYELTSSSARVNAAVAKVALEMALSGQDGDMTRFWLQSRAGWRPKSQIDHTGIDKDADEARTAREKLFGGGAVQEAAAGSEAGETREPNGS